MILYKTVQQSGGDYSDLVTGISGIIASGLAASGAYDEFVLSVDNGHYSGAFDIQIPYSGILYIVGSGTCFSPTAVCSISGSTNLADLNFEISNINMVNFHMASPMFYIYSNTTASFRNVDFIDTISGIISSGTVYLDNVGAHGLSNLSGGVFFYDRGRSIITNSRIAYFDVGIYSYDTSLTDTVMIDNNRHIISTSGLIALNNCLVYGGSSGIIFECTPTGELFIYKTDIKVPVPVTVSGVNLTVTESIMYGATRCIYGVVETGLIQDCCLYPSGTSIPLTQINVINTNPLFKNSNYGDFRLRFKQTTGSPCVELKDKGILDSSVTLITDQAQFSIRDDRGLPPPGTLSHFIYKQGNTLIISDYLKERQFAKAIDGYDNLNYTVEMSAQFEASGVPVKSSFNTINAPFPYDWDYKTFETTEITDRHKYIIPRSIVDTYEAMSGFLGTWIDKVIFSKFDKRYITPYQHHDFRGVTYDYDLSVPGSAIVWMIEGYNQTLIQMNAFTGERLAEYPLFVPDISSNQTVKPSGVIRVGVSGDRYKYALESDPNIELLCENTDGRFKWISTDIDTHKDARGILAYKNDLYITVTEYNPQSIYDRTEIPQYSGSIGKILRYDNNNTFEHYIANYTTQTGPSGFILSSGNCYPTDLTVYEDGTFLVADWYDRDKLFRYRPAYDYALVQSTYDTETRILLREYYDNVEL